MYTDDLVVDPFNSLMYTDDLVVDPFNSLMYTDDLVVTRLFYTQMSCC